MPKIVEKIFANKLLFVIQSALDCNYKETPRKGNKMNAVETAKVIRKELATEFAGIKFSVRKEDAHAIYVYHNLSDLAQRREIHNFLQKFTGWNDFGVEYVFESAA